tara:strand:+ start:1132 stop:1320 length:189 start_codon:yes stop_codon:yes gene_type:complete
MKNFKTLAKVQVFKNNLSSEEVKSFGSIEDFLKWNDKNNVFADCVAINDCLLLGFDELFDFV